MKQLLLTLLSIAIALAVTAGSIFGLHDSRILTPAPEAAAESFLDKFAVRRHRQALEHVDPAASVSPSSDSLALVHRTLGERLGGFKVETTNRLWMSGDRAAAQGILKGDTGERVSVTLPLARVNGRWLVSDLRALVDLAR